METENKTIQAAHKRRFEGAVVGANSAKTIHVNVKTIKTHPKYHKQYVTAKKYPVHDEHGRASVGDYVMFEECRPISKTKRWTLVKILKSASKVTETI